MFEHFSRVGEGQVASLADELQLEVAAARQEVVEIQASPESELLAAGIALVTLQLVMEVADVVFEGVLDPEGLVA